jgi:hypothetical protein
MNSAKKQLNRFLEDGANRACASNVFWLLLRQHNTGKLAEMKQKVIRDPNKIWNGIELLKDEILRNEEFTASVVPTIVSSDRARSFLFEGEKKPTEEGIYRWLHMLLSGLYSGAHVLNLINLDEGARREFRECLINAQVMFADQRGIDARKLMKICHGAMPWNEHALAFLFLNYFLYWLREQTKANLSEEEYKKFLDDIGLPRSLLEDYKITDETTLVLFIIPPRGKREMHYFPRLRSFIQRWYSDFFSDPKLRYPPLGMFTSSLYIRDKEYRDLSEHLLNKFIYYLLQGRINGELLEKLIVLKTHYVFATERKAGITRASNFYSKLG